jgi:hypothetical protein
MVGHDPYDIPDVGAFVGDGQIQHAVSFQTAAMVLVSVFAPASRIPRPEVARLTTIEQTVAFDEDGCRSHRVTGRLQPGDVRVHSVEAEDDRRRTEHARHRPSEHAGRFRR